MIVVSNTSPLTNMAAIGKGGTAPDYFADRQETLVRIVQDGFAGQGSVRARNFLG